MEIWPTKFCQKLVQHRSKELTSNDGAKYLLILRNYASQFEIFGPTMRRPKNPFENFATRPIKFGQQKFTIRQNAQNFAIFKNEALVLNFLRLENLHHWCESQSKKCRFVYDAFTTDWIEICRVISNGATFRQGLASERCVKRRSQVWRDASKRCRRSKRWLCFARSFIKGSWTILIALVV